MPRTRTYKVEDRIYNLPEEKVDAFLKKYPQAQKVEGSDKKKMSTLEGFLRSIAPSKESLALSFSGVPGAQSRMMTEVAGNVASTPSRALYSGIKSATSDKSFAEALAGKTELGKLVLGENANPLAEMALDIAGDPTIYLGGALAKLTKGSKVVKGRTALEGVIKTAQKETKNIKRVKPDIASLSEMPKIKVRSGIKEVTSDPVREVMDALDKLPRLLKKQRSVYAKERGSRAAGMEKLAEKFEGEKLYTEQLKYLKKRGELKKIDFSSIRKAVPQESVDEVFQIVEKTDTDVWTKLTAKRGLAKIFGEEGGKVPTKSELKAMREFFPEDFIKSLESKTPLLQQIKHAGVNILNLPRAIMATVDLSAPLRQGVFLIGRQRQFAPAFKEMFKYAFNEKAYDDFMKGIRKRPTYHLMDEHGLSLTEMGTDLTKREEVFMSNLAEKIPLFGRIAKGSNRAYSGFLNKLRVDVFDDLVKKADKLGVMTDETVEGIAKYVNAATGRGGLGKLETSAGILNGTLFSPRLVASRIEIMGKLFNPKMYTKKNALLRKEYLRDLIGFLGAGTTTLSLANMAGAEVGLDPRSSDFGKIKIGNTRYDVWGGFQQYAVLLYRLLSGETVSSTTGREYKLGEEGYKPTTRADILSRGLEFKLSPVTSYAWNAFRGFTSIGKKFEYTPEAIDRVIPIIAQDLVDLAEKEGLVGIGMTTPAVFGVGVQTYGKRIPYPAKTPSGRETTRWRFEPTIGERIVNMATGEKVTSYSSQKQQELQEKRELEIQRNIKIDKAKERVQKTGSPETVGNTYIYKDKDGVLKTKRKKKALRQSELREILNNL